MRETAKSFFEATQENMNQKLSIEHLCDYLHSITGRNEKPHAHNYTEILWMTKGSGRLHLDLQVFDLEPGCMYFIQPGEVHRFLCEQETYGYIISLPYMLSENRLTETGLDLQIDLLSFMKQQKKLFIPQLCREDIQDIIERMMKEISSTSDYSNEILFRYFNIFLFYLKKQIDDCFLQIMQTRNIQVLEQFKDLVNKHYKTKKMVSDYASELNLTPNYLNEIIKKTTGGSAGHFIRQRVALEAKRYAMHSGICMKEIGYHLGFSDMAHFSKFFKSAVGSNFTDFKNKKRQLAISL